MTARARHCLPVILLTFLAATGVSPLVAQTLVVRVVGDDSTAVAHASVDFWAKTRRVLSLQTRSDGQAVVERAKLRGLTSVGARAIGYRAASVPAAARRDTVTVALNRAPPRLPDIVVEPMPRYDCHPDDREARAVWRTASSRYVLPIDRGYWARGRGTEEAVPLSRVSSSESWGDAQWVVSGQARLQSERFIRDSGYAIRRKGKAVGIVGPGDSGPWWYPRLHTWDADHFARPEFGQFNSLFLVSSGPTGWTIGFCSNRPKRPGISGEMRIDSSYALVSAQWEYVTPRPREDAGGEIVFLAGTRTALLPLTSYAWRRLNRTDGDEAVYQREGFLGDQWTINLGERSRDEGE